MYHITDNCENPVKIQIGVENQVTVFEVDLGSPISAISEQYFRQRKELLKLRMHETKRVFHTYSGGTIIPIGILTVGVVFRNSTYTLNLFVVPGNSTPIMGRDWLNKLKILKIN